MGYLKQNLYSWTETCCRRALPQLRQNFHKWHRAGFLLNANAVSVRVCVCVCNKLLLLRLEYVPSSSAQVGMVGCYWITGSRSHNSQLWFDLTTLDNISFSQQELYPLWLLACTVIVTCLCFIVFVFWFLYVYHLIQCPTRTRKTCIRNTIASISCKIFAVADVVELKRA